MCFNKENYRLSMGLKRLVLAFASEEGVLTDLVRVVWTNLRVGWRQ